ncbi:hypothetical protein [Halopseudomonas sabulinigri]|uniref:Uncharacterized protein n=1 Tax=Halopseudomonas sabulinigri TaxID=472181 RepID=A0ABP9ZJJ3_9GAMM
MGLIVLPLLAAWFAAFVYSGFILYAIFSDDKPLWYVVTALGAGVVLALCYPQVGLSGFKTREDVWAFEIPLYFLLNKVAIVVCVAAAACHFFGWGAATTPHFNAVCFVLGFAVSAGTLTGTLYADRFQQKQGIGTTY